MPIHHQHPRFGICRGESFFTPTDKQYCYLTSSNINRIENQPIGCLWYRFGTNTAIFMPFPATFSSKNTSLFDPAKIQKIPLHPTLGKRGNPQQPRNAIKGITPPPPTHIIQPSAPTNSLLHIKNPYTIVCTIIYFICTIRKHPFPKKKTKKKGIQIPRHLHT